MASLSGEELQGRLRKFAARWAAYQGTERAEAQTFLNELFEAYGQNRLDAGARFEDPQADGGIVDLLHPGVAIIEMKAPAESSRLEKHREQALRYWHHSDDRGQGKPAPPYVVLCSFQRFEVWQPGQFPSTPRDSFDLAELPDRYESLLFLARQEPLFLAHHRHLTTDAAEKVASLYAALSDRQADSPATIRLFLLQSVWCLFAESLGLLRHHPFSQILEELLASPTRSSAAELGHLFMVLNLTMDQEGPRGGLYAGAPYVNGGLFAEPARLHLTPQELRMLAEVASFDWKEVDPTIFGALMEDCLGRDRRWELGAHYTYEADIMRIVRPTIIEPWTDKIAAASSVPELVRALEQLCQVRVLDPACGCGNFLYIAYREIRELEQRAKARISQMATEGGFQAPKGLPAYSIANVHGIEVDEFAVLIARLTLWMGHKLVSDKYGLVEPVLPLVDLSGIQAADALATPWPEVDVIIGNPPFNGSQHLRSALGDDYVEWLKRTFNCGVKDLCVYWFRKAADHLQPGCRAGLVGTNSISQNRARGASLDYVVQKGGVITSAVSTEVWPGDANVHVSIVNWIKSPETPPSKFVLDEFEVSGINTSLRPADGSANPLPLSANVGHCFQGPIPAGDGFVISVEEAQSLLADPSARYAEVVKRYLVGEDIGSDPHQQPRRWIIDFASMPLERAQTYPRALHLVEQRVRPVRATNNRAVYRNRWWCFAEPRVAMRAALAGLSRYLAGTAQGTRLLLSWCDVHWCPSNLTNVFAFDDDYSYGVLSASAHLAWARRWSSTLGVALRYTPTSAFATFPWPYPVADNTREDIGHLAAQLVTMRQDLCAAYNVGMTQLYNTMNDGGHLGLAGLHRRLDEAVAEAYGWEADIAHDPQTMVEKLAIRNAEIANGAEYQPFTKASSGSAGGQITVDDVLAEGASGAQ